MMITMLGVCMLEWDETENAWTGAIECEGQAMQYWLSPEALGKLQAQEAAREAASAQATAA